MGCFKGWKLLQGLLQWLKITLPETNSSHLEMDGWKTSFLLEWLIFRGYVSFREGMCLPTKKKYPEVLFTCRFFIKFVFGHD